MLVTVALSVAVTILAISAIAGVVAVWRRGRAGPQAASQEPPREPHPDPWEPVRARLAVLEAQLAGLAVTVQGLPSLWEEERERATKQANRATQALRELEEKRLGDSADEEPYPDLNVLPVDADGRGKEGMQDVQSGLGGHTTPDIHARAAELLNVFGRR